MSGPKEPIGTGHSHNPADDAGRAYRVDGEVPTTPPPVPEIAGDCDERGRKETWGFCDPSLVRTHAQSRAELESFARGYHIWPDANFLLRQCCARVRAPNIGLATHSLTETSPIAAGHSDVRDYPMARQRSQAIENSRAASPLSKMTYPIGYARIHRGVPKQPEILKHGATNSRFSHSANR